VSEYYVDEKNNIRKRNVAYIRATSVANNTYAADGKMLTSKFTPIASKRIIRKGMDITQKNDHRMEFYTDLIFNEKITNFNIGLEYINFYLTGGFSGRMFFDANVCRFDTSQFSSSRASFIGVRIGYNVGFNVFSNISIHDFASVGYGSSSEEGSFINDMSYSCGLTANFSYFYPVTLYFRMEKIGLMTGIDGLYPAAVGAGFKYAF